MSKTKEIKVNKYVLNLILKPIILSILTLFIVQHFGRINGGEKVTQVTTDGDAWYMMQFNFRNPINGKIYYEYSDAENGIMKDRKETYLMKLRDFYIPSLFGNLSHIIICAILFSGLFAFFGVYKFKIIK